MLSGETAVGEYPVRALKTMAQICNKTEENIDYIKRFENLHINQATSVSNAISHSSCTTAHDLGSDRHCNGFKIGIYSQADFRIPPQMSYYSGLNE